MARIFPASGDTLVDLDDEVVLVVEAVDDGLHRCVVLTSASSHDYDDGAVGTVCYRFLDTGRWETAENPDRLPALEVLGAALWGASLRARDAAEALAMAPRVGFLRRGTPEQRAELASAERDHEILMRAAEALLPENDATIGGAGEVVVVRASENQGFASWNPVGLRTRRPREALVRYVPDSWQGPPPGSTLEERLELAAVEWSRGASALAKTDPAGAGAALRACAQGVRELLNLPQRDGLPSAAERLAARWRAEGGREQCVCADRVDMILRSTARDAQLSAPKLPPIPSVLYDDSEAFRAEYPGGLFYVGELDCLVGDTAARLRDLTLAWSGVHAELRPRELAIVGPQLEVLRRHLTAANLAVNVLSDALEGTRSRGTDGENDE